ncbi:MAG TPA: hypothetical protein VFN22_03670 [Gemmatimonadales bacterium]|nr:hypothetical protein [Gemmatimonadales bacterium]
MVRTLRSALASLALIGAPTLLHAQGGGVAVWSMHATLPDTVQQAVRGMLSTIDLRMTMATDGQRVSMLIAPGPEMIASSLTTDLSTVRLQVVMSGTDDTVHIGVVLPPEIAAMMGGGLGFRLDMPLPASLLEGMLPDSMLAVLASDSMQATTAEFHDTGRSDTVAGIDCHIWTLAGLGMESADSLEMCVAPQPPALKAMSSAMRSRFASLMSKLEQIGADKPSPFGTKDQMAVRVRMQGDANFTLELVSMSNDAPAVTYFELPPGLEPFPMELLQGMTGAAGQPTGT